jgi:hypothetical protein
LTKSFRVNKKTARGSDPRHRIAQVDFSGIESQKLQVKGFQAGENQRVRTSDEDQTLVRFYIYHIPQPTPK